MPVKKSTPNRTIYLNEVTIQSTNEVIKFIYEVNIEDKNNKAATREPIKLIINSDGGDVYSGFGLVEVIQASETPVYTICHGQIQSMALLIFTVGYKRFIGKYSTAMYHEINWDIEYAPGAHHKQELDEAARCQLIYDNLMIEHSSVTKKQLDKIKESQKYWYMTPEEVIKYKIADQILEDSLAI